MKLIVAVVAAFLVAFVLFLLFSPAQVHAQILSWPLTWTATGDDSTFGQATSYLLRYSTIKPDTTNISAMDSWWASAIITPILITPKTSGSTEVFTVNGSFLSGTHYYFVLKACDEVPNCSPYSNLCDKFIPDTIAPRRIFDLR